MIQDKKLLESYFLGAFRDGSAKFNNKKYNIVIWQKNKNWLEFIQKILIEVFNIKTPIKNARNGYKLKFSSKKLFNWLLGKEFPFSGEQIFWGTPSFIKDREMIRWYIAGFFDAEGGIGVYKKDDKKYINIDFYHSWNNSKECPPLRDIRNFLISLKIKTGGVRLRTKTRMSNYPRFVLSISNDESIRKFNSLIPFQHPDKKSKLALLLA